MDQPTDPLARQLALTALTSEHFNLQTARMGTIAEANGRSALYLAPGPARSSPSPSSARPASSATASPGSR
jgi:hypothetical protein